MINFREIPFGFEWGAAKAERLASNGEYVVLGISTPRERLEITVTPSGLMRVGKVEKVRK
jgi:hypothetical protein